MMVKLKYLLLLLLLGVFSAGCFHTPSKEELIAKENEIATIAKQYLKEKYKMLKPHLEGVSLEYEEIGAIPDFDIDVPRSGVASFSYKGKAFKVIVSTDWGKFTNKFQNIVADDFQAAEIKNSIVEKIIKKFTVTNEYEISTYEVSSLTGEGKIGYYWPSSFVFNKEIKESTSYFCYKDKFDGNIDRFLKDHDISLKLQILYIGNEKDKAGYLSKTKTLFDHLVKRFGDGESEISLTVSPQSSNGPFDHYCSISGKTHNTNYIDYIKKNYKGTRMKRLEVEVYHNQYIPIDNGISFSSQLANVEFQNKKDLKYSVKLMSGTDLFSKADLKALDYNPNDQDEYGFLNNNIYTISYPRGEYNGDKVYWTDMISIKVDKSIVPKGAEKLFLLYKQKNGNLVQAMTDIYSVMKIHSEGAQVQILNL